MRKVLACLAVAACLFSAARGMAHPGATVEIGQLDILGIPEWRMRDIPYGGKLFLSDSPEIFERDGILYQDTVQGDVRLFFHHVNGCGKPKKLAVILENPGPEPVTVIVYKYGIGGPGLDYLAIGKDAQTRYFSSPDLYYVHIPGRGAALLDPRLETMVLHTRMLVNGIYDFLAEQPVTVRVAAMAANADPLEQIKRLAVLPPDQYHLRGTFAHANRLKIPAEDLYTDRHSPRRLTLADGQIDPFIIGIDATDGSTVRNYGNYGVVYNVFLPLAVPVGETRILLNPRGGAFAGALQIGERMLEEINTVLMPGDRGFLAQPSQAAQIGNYSGRQTLWLSFMPPGASNLPVKVLMLPGT